MKDKNKSSAPFGDWDINVLNSIDIDIQDDVARKAARLLWGQGFHLTSSQNDVNKFLNKIKRRTKIEDLAYQNEKMLSKYGRSIITLDRTTTGEYNFSIVDPRITSKVGRAWVTEVAAVLWKQVYHDDKQYWIKETYDTQKVTKEIFGDEEGKISIDVMGYNSEVPDDLKIDPKWEHKLGVLPLKEFRNLPDETFMELWKGYNPDERNAKDLKDIIRNLLIQSVKESIKNQTRITGNVTPENMNKIAADATNELKMLSKEFWVHSNATNENGIEKSELKMGNPKFETYLNAIKGYTKMYYNSCGYEFDDGVQATTETATGVIMGKARDVETTKEKRRQRTIEFQDLIDRVLQCENYMASPYDDRPYNFEIKENLVIDELKRTETLEKQVKSGFIKRSKAVAITNNVSETKALELIKEIDKEAHESPFKSESYELEDNEGNKFTGKTPYEAGYTKEQASKGNKIKRK